MIKRTTWQVIRLIVYISYNVEHRKERKRALRTEKVVNSVANVDQTFISDTIFTNYVQFKAVNEDLDEMQKEKSPLVVSEMNSGHQRGTGGRIDLTADRTN